MQEKKSRRPLIVAVVLVLAIGGLWAVLASGVASCGSPSEYEYYKCKYQDSSRNAECREEYESQDFVEGSLGGGPCPGDPQ